MAVDLETVTKEELLDLLEELYDVCSEDESFAKGKKHEIMNLIQLLFIEIGLLVF